MNFYLQILTSIALPNKYTRHYSLLCQKALFRSKSRSTVKRQLGYVEQHHIIPKSIEPKYKKEVDNLVFFTPKEHYIAHRLLVKMFTGKNASKMANAIYQIVKCSTKYQFRYKINARTYNEIRMRYSELCSGKNAIRFGVTLSQETKDKIAIGNTGKIKFTQEQRNEMSKRFKNVPKSPSQRAKQSASAKARTDKRNKGRMVIHNPETKHQTFILPYDFAHYQHLGYVKGRRPFKTRWGTLSSDPTVA